MPKIIYQKALMILILFLLNATSVCSQEAKISTAVGDLRFHEFKNVIFDNTRILRVFLPPEYDKDPKKKYPVLYLNDGQNLFDVSTSIFNPMEWKVDETVLDLIKKQEIEPLIIVGIDNAGKRDRPNEYLPFEDKYLSPPMPNPNGQQYPEIFNKRDNAFC